MEDSGKEQFTLAQVRTFVLSMKEIYLILQYEGLYNSY